MFKKKLTEINSKNAKNIKAQDYFSAAKSWNYDRYQSQLVLANRWQLAFWLQLFASFILVILLLSLLPLKSWEPIVVHQNSQTGEVWVESAREHYLPKTSSEIESDLVRYVIARETHAAFDRDLRFQQVMYSSSPAVARMYQNEIAGGGDRHVAIEEVVFLNNDIKVSHAHKIMQQLAKLDFTTTTTVGENTKKEYWVATIAWDYTGTPTSKTAAWQNWNGFTVTDYRVDQRNVSKEDVQ